MLPYCDYQCVERCLTDCHKLALLANALQIKFRKRLQSSAQRKVDIATTIMEAIDPDLGWGYGLAYRIVVVQCEPC